MKNISLQFLQVIDNNQYIVGGDNRGEKTYTFLVVDTTIGGLAARSLHHEDDFYFAVMDDPARDWLEEAIHYFDSARQDVKASFPNQSLASRLTVAERIGEDVWAYALAYENGAEATVAVIDKGNSRLAEAKFGHCSAKLESGWWNFQRDEGDDLLKAVLRFHEARFYSVEQVEQSRRAAQEGKSV